MPYYYSATTNGFYTPDINPTMPPDVVELTDDEYYSTLAGQDAGFTIAPGADGYPALLPPPVPTPTQISEQTYNTLMNEYSKNSFMMAAEFQMAITEESRQGVQDYFNNLADLSANAQEAMIAGEAYTTPLPAEPEILFIPALQRRAAQDK